jgi:hypothetical protein
MLAASDGGAIYLVNPGTMAHVHHNWISGISGKSSLAAGNRGVAYSIYLDRENVGDLVEHNCIYHEGSDAAITMNGEGIRMLHNVVVLASAQPMPRGAVQVIEHATALMKGGSLNMTLVGNVIYRVAARGNALNVLSLEWNASAFSRAKLFSDHNVFYARGHDASGQAACQVHFQPSHQSTVSRFGQWVQRWQEDGHSSDSLDPGLGTMAQLAIGNFTISNPAAKVVLGQGFAELNARQMACGPRADHINFKIPLLSSEAGSVLVNRRGYRSNTTGYFCLATLRPT